jgi:ribosomal protein S18 acetylase RimI-like enzyme
MTPDPVTPNVIPGGAELLARIQPLWAELRLHHAYIAGPWKQEFLDSDFDKRKANLITKGTRGLLVLLAIDGDQPVGYCVSTIDPTGRGEIDSLFVTASHRRRALGRRLVQQSMDWLTRHAAKTIVVSVLAGNDDATKLYASFGFQLRTIMFQHVAGE